MKVPMSEYITTFKRCLEKAKKNLHFSVQRVILDFSEQVIRRMQILGINKAALAERLETSPAYVTKMLKCETNFTIESMTKLANVLEAGLEIRLCAKNIGSEWFRSESESVVIVEEQDAAQKFKPSGREKSWQRPKKSQIRRKTVLEIT